MTSESMVQVRRNTQLAVVIGAVLASYAGGAQALEFEFDDGARVNWNTTLSAGASWRNEEPSRLLYTMADGALIGKFTGGYIPGTAVARGNGLAGNDAAGDSNLNYARGDRFSTPFKILSDVEYKKGRFGGLVRIKAWYDQATSENDVRVGNQANNFNGTSTDLTHWGPTSPNCTPVSPLNVNCAPRSQPGVNKWPRAKLSDDGFEDEQKFSNLMLLDAYVYGSFAIGDSDLQLRLGNQVVNWGESLFIQGVNQINPIDVPAARRSGAEIKEILLPAWLAYANWGLSFGSVEAFYQFEWNNTSIDSCGTYWGVTNGIISTDPGKCLSATPITPVVGSPVAGTSSPTVPQFGSNPWSQYNGLYVPLGKGREASNSGQFGVAFRFPVEMIDTEVGLYAMNIHSRLPIASGYAGTSITSLNATQRAALTQAGLIGTDALGPFWALGSSRLRGPSPFHAANAKLVGAAIGQPINITPGSSLWEYPEDIQIFGVSTASNIAGWSVSSELSYQKDVPVQVNGNDLLNSLLALVGPNAAEGLETFQKNDGQSGRGAYIRGYDQFDVTQFQVNGLKTFSNVLGAENLLVIGEVGAQWNNVPDYTTGAVRYGRGFMWGHGSSPAYATGATAPTLGSTCSPTFLGVPVPVPAGSLYNPSPRGCKNDGYVTDFAWGYRLRVSMDYNNVMNSGVTVTPSVFWSQDVEGVSALPTFIEDRSALNLGLRFNFKKRYDLQMNYVQFGNSGYDPLFDRDYYSASVSMTF
jgi:hypothetical protein